MYAGATRPPADDLVALAGELSRDPESAADAIRSRAQDWDGEFVAVMYLKQDRRLWVFSDGLGRLPLYAARSDRCLTLSRDQRFVLEHEGSAAVDPLGIAQLLLFGFPLGRRTLIRDVGRVPAGCAFRVDTRGIREIEGPREPLDFDRKDRAADSADRNAADLADLFIHACRIRADAGDRPLLALSGGLDSRAVAAGLARAGRAFDCYTFVDDAGVHARETPVAGEVARALGIPWRSFQAPAPRGSALQRMLAMKTGLNTLAMAYSIDVFERLRSGYGPRLTYWSGDGGDKVLPDHRPRLSRRGAADLTGYLIGSRPISPVAKIARLLGIREEEIRASVEEVVRAYPERSADQRFVRFQFVERGARWIFEGEDCNRHYFWTVSPFYDRAFLRVALACPDDQKSGHQLYRRFLRNLHPRMTRIPDANLGIPMDSPAYAWSRRLREVGRRFPRLRRWLRQGVPASVLQPRSQLLSAIFTRQLERSEAVRARFSRQAMGEVAAAPGRWSDAALDGLLTATCAVEEIVERRSTLDEFGGESFG